MPMKLHSIAAAAALVLLSTTALAQNYPGGGAGGAGGHRTEGRSGPIGTSIQRPTTAASRTDTVSPHPMRALSDALSRERQNLQLSPDAARAWDDLQRDLKDFAALDDRRTGVRVGWTKHTVYAAVDLQRDLVAQEDEAHALAAAAADLVKDWKALEQALSAEQRTRVLAIYAGVPPPKAAQ
jgi:hypothetical protein